MGRQIRKVAKNWQHPTDESGEYRPMHDQFFEDAFNEWEAERKKWLAGKNSDAKKYDVPKTNAGFIEWHGEAPEPAYYRQVKWTEEEACCFQFYETVSEGTPLSPVFDTPKELEDWLVTDQGHSRTAAENFCKSGYAPSFTMQVGEQGVKILKQGVDSCD